MQKNLDVIAILYRSSLEGDENILKLIVVMVTQLCEHTKNHYITWLYG